MCAKSHGIFDINLDRIHIYGRRVKGARAKESRKGANAEAIIARLSIISK
ncbi:hypothetical protein PUN28_018592 [Cardiocondyla obscurior]|uniref:Uncharacterized protein n=1 Tax=Cardiocondyla obscurior TaxID=286306 RepID=A0AAW2EGP4_9HYME